MRTQTEQQKNAAEEHILVCLSSSLSNTRIIHTAARMAKVLGARFTAIRRRLSNAAGRLRKVRKQEIEPICNRESFQN